MSTVYTIHFHNIHNHLTDLSLFLLESKVFGFIIFLIKFWFFDSPPPPLPSFSSSPLAPLSSSTTLHNLLPAFGYHVSISSPTPTPPFPLVEFYLVSCSSPNLVPHIHSPLCGCLVQLQKQTECGVSKCHSRSKSELNVVNSPQVR